MLRTHGLGNNNMMKCLGEHFKTKIKYVESEHQVILIEMGIKMQQNEVWIRKTVTKNKTKQNENKKKPNRRNECLQETTSIPEVDCKQDRLLVCPC